MNELPIMPIRAKYADELSEGSPDRKKLDSLPVTPDVLYLHSVTNYTTNYDFKITETSSGKTYTTHLNFDTHCNWINKNNQQALNANSLRGSGTLIGQMSLNPSTSRLDNWCIIRVLGSLSYISGPGIVTLSAKQITVTAGFTIEQTSGGPDSFTSTVEHL